jgi:phosphoserine phosphatase RsbU/P
LRIQRGAERATRLVSDVLDFTQARLGEGIPMKRAHTNAHELAAQVADEVLAAHPEREVLLEATGAGDVSWDPQRIAQVLANLLGNALKYGDAGAPVTLRTRGEGAAGVVVEVHNAGAPIAAATMATMFEPMKRGSEDQSARSIGLGLYIVKHIVDAHEGTIDVSSQQDTGTTFSIRLPRGA